MLSPGTCAPSDPLLGRLADRLDSAPRDPRLTWRRTARPDQLLPGGDWRVIYFQGGRGAGKTRSSAQGFAELIQATPEPSDWGIVAPTYRDAWTVCVEGESGFLAALGTSAGEVKTGKSRTVAYAHRSYGEIGLRSGHVIYVDSANDGALRVQGKNLTACWCIAAGEMIATGRGPVPVESVRAGDRVATRRGWRKVTAHILTRRDAEVVRLTADGGQSVRLTADHRVWTANRGWRMASDLTPADRLVLWNQTPTASSSDRPPTFCGTATSGITTTAPATTGTARRADFTSPSGSTSTSAAGRPGTTFTTGTTTRPTTRPATSNSSRTASTSPTTTTRTSAASPAGTPGATARARGTRGPAPSASSPAFSAAASAAVPGKPRSTAPRSAGSSPSSRGRKTLPGSTRGRRLIRRILSGATRPRASASAPSAASPTGHSPRDPSTARLIAALRPWRDGGTRSPARTAVPASRQPAGSATRAARTASGSTTVPHRKTRGRASSPSAGPARSAASRTRPGSRTTRGTARSDAGTRHGWQYGSLTRCPEPDGRADVYDLTVEGEPEFFAGGILVHNCSEIGLWLKWATAWDESIAYAVRKGIARIIADGTPKISRPAAKLIRRLLRDEPGVVVRRLRTADNLANLSETFYRAVVARATGTRLERQELEGELLDDVENALWSRDLLESIQCELPPAASETGLYQVTVGADPSDGTEDSDECAYTVAGIGGDRRLYVPESWGGRIGAVPFLKRVVEAADRWDGRVILEKNHGGAYLTATLEQVMRDLGKRVPYEVVHASQAKRTRAEPVAALYERDVVRHVNGPHVELEDQQVTFTGAAGERSPDRLDSLVWAITPFLNHDFDLSGKPRPPATRQYASARELDDMARSPAERLRQRRASPSQQQADQARQPGGWDVDSFAPQDDDARPERANVHSWR